MTTPELRKEFTEFFVKEYGHVPVKSSSLIPHNDKSLMFTNAGTCQPHSPLDTLCLFFLLFFLTVVLICIGMVQFKDYFRNPATAPFKQATTIQKCMRAGGRLYLDQDRTCEMIDSWTISLTKILTY